MNEVLKQRLVGALILVALGVVFWPIIFVEPGAPGDGSQSPVMPPAPAIDTSPIAVPDPSGWRASTEPYDDEALGLEQQADIQLEPTEPEGEAGEPAVVAPAPAARKEAPVAPTLDDKGVPVAWSIQVATVSSAAKAGELRDSLLAMEQKAYIRKVERGDKDLYRVYVGPRFERAQLERVQAGIDKRFGVESLIVRYLP